jgi:hypothetical protein
VLKKETIRAALAKNVADRRSPWSSTELIGHRPPAAGSARLDGLIVRLSCIPDVVWTVGYVSPDFSGHGVHLRADDRISGDAEGRHFEHVPVSVCSTLAAAQAYCDTKYPLAPWLLNGNEKALAVFDDAKLDALTETLSADILHSERSGDLRLGVLAQVDLDRVLATLVDGTIDEVLSLVGCDSSRPRKASRGLGLLREMRELRPADHEVMSYAAGDEGEGLHENE